MPASTMTSASPTFWQTMPMAPAASCILAISGILCVFVCTRRGMSHLSHAACVSRIFFLRISRSMVSAGVSRSCMVMAISVLKR